MRSMTCGIASRLLLVLALVTWAAPGVAAAQDLPSGKEVLERYLEVTGGREKYASITSRITTTTLEMPAAGVKGKMTIYQQAPDKGYIQTELENLGKVEQGYNGEVAWERSAMMGARVLEGQEKETLVRSLTIGSELYPEKYYQSIETKGIEDVEGKPAYKLELTSPNGASETRYYDKESGLMVKTQTTQQTQMGEMTVIGVPSDYQEMAGIKMPRKVTQSMMGQTITLTIDSVEHDVEIPAEKFALPPDVKALAQQGATAPATQPKP